MTFLNRSVVRFQLIYQKKEKTKNNRRWARSSPRKAKSASPRTRYPRSSRRKSQGRRQPPLHVRSRPSLFQLATFLAATRRMRLFLRPRRALRVGRLPGRRTRTRRTVRVTGDLGVGSTGRTRGRLGARRTLLTVHIRFSRLRRTLRMRRTRRSRRRLGARHTLRTRATRTRHIVRPSRALLTVLIRFSRLRCTVRTSHAGTRNVSATRRNLSVSSLVFRTVSWPWNRVVGPWGSRSAFDGRFIRRSRSAGLYRSAAAKFSRLGSCSYCRPAMIHGRELLAVGACGVLMPRLHGGWLDVVLTCGHLFPTQSAWR